MVYSLSRSKNTRKEHLKMQNCTTILGVIDMRQRGISFDDCRNRFGIGNSTITLIMNRFKDSGKDLEALKQMSAEEVEKLFYPPENIIRKDISVMPDYQAVYERLSKPGSKANLFYMWLKYKKECPVSNNNFAFGYTIESMLARYETGLSYASGIEV